MYDPFSVLLKPYYFWMLNLIIVARKTMTIIYFPRWLPIYYSTHLLVTRLGQPIVPVLAVSFSANEINPMGFMVRNIVIKLLTYHQAVSKKRRINMIHQWLCLWWMDNRCKHTIGGYIQMSSCVLEIITTKTQKQRIFCFLLNYRKPINFSNI